MPPSEGGGSVFFLRGRALCAPRYAGAPREHGKAMLGTRVTFPTRGKSPKARQGLRPLESPGAWLPPFSRSLTHRAGLPSATNLGRFATLSLWANRSYFSPQAAPGVTLPTVNPWLGRIAPEDAAGSILPQPIPLGHRAGGSKGATPPSPGVQGPGGPWRIFAYFLYARK